MSNINVITCLPEKENIVVCFKEVSSHYVLQDNEYIVDIDFDSDLFGKKYDAETGTFLISQETVKLKAISWRNFELERTDSLMLLPDYPYKDQLTTYRQALRDWLATEDFPDTRPTLGI